MSLSARYVNLFELCIVRLTRPLCDRLGIKHTTFLRWWFYVENCAAFGKVFRS